jgi:hypothetical protein
MANQKQLKILKQGVNAWNDWRMKNRHIKINLMAAKLGGINLKGINLREANLVEASLAGADLSGAFLFQANLYKANLQGANLREANLSQTHLIEADLDGSILAATEFALAVMGSTRITKVDLQKCKDLENIHHQGPSQVSIDTFQRSKGRIPRVFLVGCGLSDWEIEQVKLYDPDLSNETITQIQHRIYNQRADQALQISPVFISYSHSDSKFVDKVESQLNKKGIRFWRDIHDMKSGRVETQIDRAINLNPTVLLVLSEHSLKSDWVEHEVRTARELEKELGRDTLCPVALDDSWKDSPWPKRVMEQVMEYNILDFSGWEDDVKFEGMFRRLIDGLELFYKG